MPSVGLRREEAKLRSDPTSDDALSLAPARCARAINAHSCARARDEHSRRRPVVA